MITITIIIIIVIIIIIIITIIIIFYHKPGTIRNFLKTPPFSRGYGAQAVGASACHEISHMRRRYSACRVQGVKAMDSKRQSNFVRLSK